MTRKPSQPPNDPESPLGSRPYLEAVARRMLRERDVFARTFPTGYIRDPILDLLLTIYLGTEQSGERDIMPLYDPSGSTVSDKRWLAVLLADGLAERQGTLVGLTAIGTNLVEQALSELAPH